MTSSPRRDPEETTRRPRRRPAPDERVRDAERTRHALLDAALDEFSEKGFDRARIQDIADRAGVNKQLISYYFGGKKNLYREIQRRWRESETAVTDPDLPLADVADRYLAAGLADPRAARLMTWHGLTTGDADTGLLDDTTESDLTNLRRARTRGDIPADLDPAFLRIALMAITTAPATLPHVTRASTGLPPDSPEFQTWYRTQLRTLLTHLADPD